MLLKEAKEILRKNGFIAEGKTSFNGKIRNATVFTGTSSDKDVLINELENTYDWNNKYVFKIIEQKNRVIVYAGATFNFAYSEGNLLRSGLKFEWDKTVNECGLVEDNKVYDNVVCKNAKEFADVIDEHLQHNYKW